MKRHFTNAICMPVEPFAVAMGPIVGCGSPRSDVLITALSEVKKMWSFRCELFLFAVQVTVHRDILMFR